MISRYDMMTSSNTSDIDNQPFPDVLSVDFNSFKYTQPPYQVEPNDSLEKVPYVTASALYGVAAYEDIVFMINNVPHVSLLDNFDIIKFPVLVDIVAFMKGT
jgi:hypothetical protein